MAQNKLYKIVQWAKMRVNPYYVEQLIGLIEGEHVKHLKWIDVTILQIERKWTYKLEKRR